MFSKKLLILPILAAGWLLLPVLHAEMPQEIKKVHSAMPNDMMKTEIYKLSNGLTVYLSVNKLTPRIFSYIAVPTGAVDDPSDKTGLAHYLEHLLFKGSQKIGTTDYEKEKALLNQIEELYLKHEKLTDEVEREKVYQEIDRLSGTAAQYGVQNEFVTALSAMGGTDINAFTSYDVTAYVSSIPSNQLSKWLKLEYDRFLNPVFRGFHTELETVYEEANMSQDNAGRRFWYFLYENLFPGHPRSRPVLGIQEHLKNPSPRAVMNFYRQWYVPNNMVICLAGDFDPQAALKEIEDTFGHLKPAPLQKTNYPCPPPIKGEIIKEMSVPDYEMSLVTWRIDSTDQQTEDMLDMIGSVMSNGAAGILDQNVNIPQKATASFCSGGVEKGLFGTFMIGGIPKAGDTPENLKTLLDGEIEKLKKGDFPDWLPQAIVRNRKLSLIRAVESNENRASTMLSAFTDSKAWADVVNTNDRLSKITKKDIQDFAKRYFGNDRLVLYRRSGAMTPGDKLPKPPVTPLEINRNAHSAFFEELNAMKVKDIEPQFPDLKKEVITETVTVSGMIPFEDSTLHVKRSVPVISTINTRDEFFTVQFVYNVGASHDKLLQLLGGYSAIAGTESKSMEEIKVDLFRLAGSVSLSADDDETVLSISGLKDDFKELVVLAQTFIDQPKVNDSALQLMNERILMSRKVSKEKPADVLWEGLFNYIRFGANNPNLYTFDTAELNAVKAADIVDRIKGLKYYPCRVRYFGPDRDKIATEINALAQSKNFTALPETRASIPHQYIEQPTDTQQVFFVHVPNLRQVQMIFYRKSGTYNMEDVGIRSLFNDYFGGGMSSVTFQRLREANSLCYSCSSRYKTPDDPRYNAYYYTYLTTQANKADSAIEAVNALGFPVSAQAIASSQNQLLKNVATERWYGWGLINLYESYRKKGLPDNYREYTYQRIQDVSAADLVTFYKTQIEPVKPTLLVIGDETTVDMKIFEKFGPVIKLSVDDIFPK